MQRHWWRKNKTPYKEGFFIFFFMKILFENKLILSFVPREIPIESEINVILRNEMTNVLIDEKYTYSLVRGKVFLTINPNSDFTAKNKYEVEVKELDKTIYRGKVIYLEEGTDIQNYNQRTQTNKIYAYTE